MKDDVSLMRKLKLQGKTLKELSEIFHCSETTIEYWVYPEQQEKKKIKAKERMRSIRESWSPEQKQINNIKIAETLKRKRTIQPEYIKYNTLEHNKYSKSEKAVETRKKYYAREIEKMKFQNKKNYLKHREKRIAYQSNYYKSKRCPK